MIGGGGVMMIMIELMIIMAVGNYGCDYDGVD